MSKLNAGDVLDHRELLNIRGDVVHLPDPQQLVHLQFRRYAGCPICHQHLGSVALRYDEILVAGIHEVVVVHSTAETMREFQGNLPFTAIADPQKSLYAEFGVEISARSLLNPAAWVAAGRGVVQQRSLRGARGSGETHLGLPADFLIGTDGRVLARRYGTHANDQWSVDHLLELVRTMR